MKKGTIVYFKKYRLIEWETSLLDYISSNRLYSVIENGSTDGKQYVKIWDGGSHFFHKDHFVEANIELLDIPVFEIGDDIECIDKTFTGSQTSGRKINELVIGGKYKVVDYIIANNIPYVIYDNSGYYLEAKLFKKC